MKSHPPIIQATPEQIEFVRRAVQSTIENGVGCGVDAFYQMFPTLRPALDALPDLGPLAKVLHELRVCVMDALRAVGVDVPKKAYDHLGLSDHWTEEPPLVGAVEHERTKIEVQRQLLTQHQELLLDWARVQHRTSIFEWPTIMEYGQFLPGRVSIKKYTP